MILKQVYTPLALLPSLTIGTTFIPTLRMLLITPTSFGDILVGKLLVVLVVQLAMTTIMLTIRGGFSGAVPLGVLYVLSGACLSLS